VNQLALKAGAQYPPFIHVEPLAKDTGERFFSGYLQWLQTTKMKYDSQDRCLCQLCGVPTTPAISSPVPTNPSPLGMQSLAIVQQEIQSPVIQSTTVRQLTNDTEKSATVNIDSSNYHNQRMQLQPQPTIPPILP
jgi:hypothetical protein